MGAADAAAAALARRVTPAERAELTERVRQVVPEPGDGDAFSSNWARERWHAFLLELEADGLDGEGYLDRCRELGLTGPAVDRLLESGRVEDAAAEMARDRTHRLPEHADRLAELDRPDLAEDLVRDRRESEDDWRLARWLEEFYINREDWAAALDLARPGFEERPSLDGYRTLREYAEHLGDWDALRGELHRVLKDRAWDAVRVKVYLDEGEIDAALKLATRKARKTGPGGPIPDELRLEVARAAEETRPEAALAIYQDRVPALIEARGRPNYAAACELLRSICALAARLGRPDEAEDLIAAVRSENPTLRALRDEMGKARGCERRRPRPRWPAACLRLGADGVPATDAGRRRRTRRRAHSG